MRALTRRRAAVAVIAASALAAALVLALSRGDMPSASRDAAAPTRAAVTGSEPPFSATSGGHATEVRECGVFVRTVDSGGISAAGWRCFTDAMTGGRSARLRLTTYTTEGDPVFLTYTTKGDGAATVLTDSRLDKFGGNGSRLQTETCRRPDPRPVARGMFLECG